MEPPVRQTAPNSAVEDGFILVALIGVLLIVAVVAQGYVLAIRSHVRSVNAEVERARGLALADSGVNLAIQHVLEKRSARAPLRGDLVAAGGWECRVGDDGIDIVIADDAGRIDLNTADDALLISLLTGMGLDRDRSARLAAAIIDFRDADDLRHPEGAETDDYRTSGRSNLPKNAPFDVIEELVDVMGFDATLIALLSPFVTVYSGHAGIDASVATEDLLALLERGTTGSSAPSLAGQRRRLPAGVVSPSPRRTYRIMATGRTATGGGAAIEAIIKLGTSRGNDFSIRRWQQIPIERESLAPLLTRPSCG